MDLSSYAQALGTAQQLIPAWDEPDRRRAALQGQQVQNQLGQQQVAENQQQLADAAAFKADVAGLPGKPTSDAYRGLALKYPRFFKPISDVADAMDAAHKQQTVSHLAQIGSAITANRPDLAAAQVQRHIDADKAAGKQPDPEDVALVDMLNSGDPEKIKGAGVLVHGSLAALDDKAAKATGPDNESHFRSTGDGAIYDDRSGDVVRQAPPKDTNAIQVPIYDDQGHRVGTQLVSNGGRGGGQASGGGGGGSAAPSGRSFGWTPRGPNSDAAVDNKNAGMSKALGIGLTDPFPANMSNLQIAKALAISEGGAGSLADKNNNPANLTDAKTGGYRKFPTKEAGLAAAAAQVARNRARGQNTIQTMVEGLPVGGRASGAQAGYFGPQVTGGGADDSTTGDAYLAQLSPGRRNLIKAIAEGRAPAPRPGSRFGEQLAEDLARAYPDVDVTSFAGRQQAVKAFTTGKQGDTVRSLNVAIDHLGVLHDAAMALRNGDMPLFNRLSQHWQTATGGPLPTNAAAVAQIVGDEITKAVIGSAGAVTDREELKKTLNTAGSPDQIVGVTRQYISLMSGQAKGLQRQYEQSTGNHDFHRFLSRTTAKQLGLNQGGPAPTRTATGPGGKKLGLVNGRWVPLK